MWKSLLCMALALAISLSLCTVSAFAKDATNLEWYNFRNNVENNGVTDRPTPTLLEETNLKWGVKYGSGWTAAPTPPLLLDGYLYIGVGNKILKLNKADGTKVAESDTMVANVGYAMNPILYADGKLFVQVGNGMIQAVDYETLKCVWSTEKIGGQTLCPISYTKVGDTGYIYTGTWNGESRDGAYLCVSTNDDGVENGKKPTSWRFIPSGDASILKNLTFTNTAVAKDDALIQEAQHINRGFYWAGSYACAKYIAVGTDDGTSEGDYTANACFYTLNPTTGAVISRVSGIKGDIRSTAVYDNGYLYFNTKGGILYKVSVDENGNLGTPQTCNLDGMTTASPLVYNGKIYLGVCGKGGQFDPDGGHRFAVINSNSMKEMYSLPIKGYPQASALLSTAHENEDFNNDGKPDGRVYIYFTYNAPPGGIYYTYDTPDQTTAAAGSQELFIPSSEKQQYCISTICADTDGTMYYKNDSCYLMAVEKNDAFLSGIAVDGAKSWSGKFAAGTTDYNVVMPFGSTSAHVTLTIPTGITATVNGAACDAGGATVNLDKNGTATIAIAAQSTQCTRTYTLHVRSQNNVSTLGALAVSTSNAFDSSKLDITPALVPGVETYSADVTGIGRSFYNIWPDATDANSTVKVYAVSNVDAENSETSSDGTIPVTSSNQGHSRYAVYPADKAKTAKVRVEVTSEDGSSVKSYAVRLLVKEAVSGVSLDMTGYTLDTTGTKDIQLHAAVNPEDATMQTVTWSSSNEAVATVDTTGKVTAVAKGSAVITAAATDDPSKTASCTINVLDVADTLANAKAALDGYAKPDNYRAAQQQALASILADAKAKMDAATDKAVIGALLADAKSAVDLLKTDAQLTAEENQAAAAPIINQINAIGAVSLNSADAIAAARTKYDALTENQKACVSNYTTLTAAEVSLKLLQQEETTKKAGESKKAEEVKKAKEASQTAIKENANIVVDETAKQVLSDSLSAAMQNDPALAAKVQQVIDSGKKVTTEIAVTEAPRIDAAQGLYLVQTLTQKTGLTVGTFYDISVVVKADGETLATLSQIGQPLTLRLKVDENMNGKTVSVCRIHNNEATLLPTVVENGYAQAQSDQFSLYALVYQDDAAPAASTSPATGDRGIMTWGIAMLMSALLSCALVCRKHYNLHSN